MDGTPKDSAIRAALADMVNAVTALKQSGHAEMAEALKKLAEAVADSGIQPQIRQEVIENLVFVGQQASLRPDKRKRGVVKAALFYTAHAMQTVPTLAQTWYTFGRIVENFFNL